jgi:hypothetical protein
MKMRYPCMALILGCLCSTSFAQNAPSGEVFGGYSYANVDVQSGIPSSNPIPRQSANGWEAAASFDVNRWFAVEGDFAGFYKNVSLGTGSPDLKIHDYSFAGGPRVSYRQGSTTAFVHALFGGDSLAGSIAGIGSGSQTSFATLVGGGVEMEVATAIALGNPRFRGLCLEPSQHYSIFWWAYIESHPKQLPRVNWRRLHVRRRARKRPSSGRAADVETIFPMPRKQRIRFAGAGRLRDAEWILGDVSSPWAGRVCRNQAWRLRNRDRRSRRPHIFRNRYSDWR